MKKPSPRDEARKKQESLSQLRGHAALERFLPAEERRKLRLIPTANGRIRAVGGCSDEKPTESGTRDRDVLALQKLYASVFGPMARDVGADKIYEAKAEYEAEFQEAVDESLQGMEAGDLTSLVFYFKMFGFELLGDPTIRNAAQEWWDGALDGFEEDKTNLKAILAALQEAALGRSKTLSKEEAAELADACEQWYSLCSVVNKLIKKQHIGRDVWEKVGDCSVESAKIAKRYLISSAQNGKASPWNATIELVANEHPIAKKYDLSPGTVEKIWQKYK